MCVFCFMVFFSFQILFVDIRTYNGMCVVLNVGVCTIFVGVCTIFDGMQPLSQVL